MIQSLKKKVKKMIEEPIFPEENTTDKVNDWFKQCVGEYPIKEEAYNNKKIIHELNTNPVFEDIIMRTQDWFYKWFSQFFPHLCHECKHMKKNTCLLKGKLPPLLSFNKSIHSRTKHVTCCSYFQGFDTPKISDEDIIKYQFLLSFLNWIHFEKGVYLARFKRKEGFTFDGMPWTIYLDEYLGIDYSELK